MAHTAKLWQLPQERAAFDRAEFLIGEATTAAAHLTDPRDKLAHEVGALRGTVRRLVAEVQGLCTPVLPSCLYEVEVEFAGCTLTAHVEPVGGEPATIDYEGEAPDLVVRAIYLGADEVSGLICPDARYAVEEAVEAARPEIEAAAEAAGQAANDEMAAEWEDARRYA